MIGNIYNRISKCVHYKLGQLKCGKPNDKAPIESQIYTTVCNALQYIASAINESPRSTTRNDDRFVIRTFTRSERLNVPM